MITSFKTTSLRMGPERPVARPRSDLSTSMVAYPTRARLPSPKASPSAKLSRGLGCS